MSEGMNRYALAVTTAALMLMLTACSSSSTSSKSTTPATGATAPSNAATTAPSATTTASSAGSTPAAAAGGIVISGFAYTGTLTVKPGEKVTVTNKDSVAHTLTDKKNHKFDTGSIAGDGGTATFIAPTTPGTYQFGCTFHPNMQGTLIVQG